MATQTERLVSSRTARAELGDVSDMTIWRWIKAGVLPQPIKINKRNYWPASAIERVKLGNAKAAA
jgi:predicted DNA-binding transcriptional regulator AlpA